MTSTAKLSSLGVLFAVSVVSGLIVPYIVYRVLSSRCQSGKFKCILGILSCFSGGVFLATTLLTLLPEAREAMEEVTTEEFPFTELLAAAGFLLILFIENVANAVFHRRQKNKSLSNGDTKPVAREKPLENGHSSYQDGNVVIYTTSNGDNKSSDLEATSNSGQESNTSDLNPEVHITDQKNTIRDVVLMLALSVHMVFDGLGIGLMDEDSKVWSVLVTVSIHRVLIFFSIGLTLCSTNTKLRFIVSMVYMSLVSVLGLGIGIAVTSQGESKAVALVSAVLQGIAVGTFLYVAICEILVKEFESFPSKHRVHKTFAVCVGCALLATVIYVTDI